MLTLSRACPVTLCRLQARYNADVALRQAVTICKNQTITRAMMRDTAIKDAVSQVWAMRARYKRSQQQPARTLLGSCSASPCQYR